MELINYLSHIKPGKRRSVLPRAIALILFVSLFFSGCIFENTNKSKYNELSRQHNQIANEALIKKDQAVDDYNDESYQEAKIVAESAKDLFEQAKKISEENKTIAEKITDIYWLVDYQDKVIESENFWIEMMSKFIEACEAQITGNVSRANQIAKELEDKIPEYQKIQKEIDQIELDHQDFFNQEE